MIMQWTEANNLGIIALDSQHRELYEMLNALHEAMHSGRGREMASVILQRILPFVRNHFKEEESALQQLNYPACDARRKQHCKQLEQLETFVADKNARDPSAVIDLLYFLDGMLEGHIETERRELRLEPAVQ